MTNKHVQTWNIYIIMLVTRYDIIILHDTCVLLPVLMLLSITVHYVMIGAEEGLFSLLITPSQDPVMEQVQCTCRVHEKK